MALVFNMLKPCTALVDALEELSHCDLLALVDPVVVIKQLLDDLIKDSFVAELLLYLFQLGLLLLFLFFVSRLKFSLHAFQELIK